MFKPAILDVKARARIALDESPIHTLRELHVEQQGETLLLSGCVETFYHKQLAQELVRAIAEDCQCVLVNSVAVDYKAEFASSRPR